MSDSPARRIPAFWIFSAAALLILSIAGVAYWQYRPKSTDEIGPGLSELEVVSLGRVDGLTPVASLDWAPGQRNNFGVRLRSSRAW